MCADRYRILPPHSMSERQSIFESIKAEGLKSPLIIDEFDQIIDGHVRRDICEELGIDWHTGVIVRAGLTDDQKKAMAVTLNLARRSTPPTAKQRREYAEVMLMANPEQSDGCIAAVVGLDDTTVCKYRHELLKDQKIRPVTHTIGLDGRRRKVSSDKRKKSFPVNCDGLHSNVITLPVPVRTRNNVPKVVNGIDCVPMPFPTDVKEPKEAEPPTHEHESVLRMLVKVNAVLTVLSTMTIASADVEAVMAEVATARTLLGQIGNAA